MNRLTDDINNAFVYSSSLVSFPKRLKECNYRLLQ